MRWRQTTSPAQPCPINKEGCEMVIGRSATQPGSRPSGRASDAVSPVPASIPSAERVFRSLYSPGTGQISCVLMQAAHRLDRRPCHFFGSGDWNTGFPADDSRVMEATESQWRAVGLMTRAERIALFSASGMSASGQDPQGLEAKPASPTAESGDAQNQPNTDDPDPKHGDKG